ncbi:tetratricopeptide repeat protein [Massilia sp. TWP1-3-3]|uniref:tetratricopeptide repeat protein n=1 Tax=Massilia sp. TWP1-3-3 TaxID=2804573 RepID=UPI003CF68E28
MITDASHAGIETARKAYERKDYAAALSEFNVLATHNHAEALSILSIMYLNGEGVPRAVQKTIGYATKAYKNGDDGGLSLLAMICLSFKAGVRDKEKGLQYLRTGMAKAEQNSLEHLAHLLVEGLEVSQDFDSAFNYDEKAANRYQSVPAAQAMRERAGAWAWPPMKAAQSRSIMVPRPTGIAEPS